jgi:hypothetical protein
VPEAKLLRLDVEPVVGALLFAADLLGGAGPELESALREAFAR